MVWLWRMCILCDVHLMSRTKIYVLGYGICMSRAKIYVLGYEICILCDVRLMSRAKIYVLGYEFFSL